MTAKFKKQRIKVLQDERDDLWKQFCRLPRRGSFAGLALSERLNAVQERLDQLEGDKPSKRYYPELNIEIL